MVEIFGEESPVLFLAVILGLIQFAKEIGVEGGCKGIGADRLFRTFVAKTLE